MNNPAQSTPTFKRPAGGYCTALRWQHHGRYPQGMNPSFILHHRNDGNPGTIAKVVGVTRNGFTVIDRENSHSHLDSTLLAEALSRVDMPDSPFAKITIPMGRVVGVSACVETTPGDAILFARRIDRKGLTRFVKDRAPIHCSNIIVILKATKAGEGVLITAFIGNHAEPEPWDRSATAQSGAFWQNHALIWGSEPVVPGTSTLSGP